MVCVPHDDGEEVVIKPHLEWKLERATGHYQYVLRLLENGKEIDYEFFNCRTQLGTMKKKLLRNYKQRLLLASGTDPETLWLEKHSGPVYKPKRRGFIRRTIALLKGAYLEVLP